MNRSYAVAIVALAAAAVYLNALGNGFALDDVWIIEQNDRVHSLADLRAILLTPYWPFFGTELGLYRPFAVLLYALQWAAGNGAAWVFHLVSILLHALASVLVLVLLRSFAPAAAALAGALLFAVHPVHTEAVANVVGQAELVAAIAMLAICVLHVRRPPGEAVSWGRRVAYVLLFAFAVGIKESVVVLPAVLVLLDLAQRRIQLSSSGVARYVDAMALLVFLLGATLAAYLLFRFQALDGQLFGMDANPALPFLREEYRVLNALRAFPEFLRLLLFPLRLSADYMPAVILPVESLTAMTLFGFVLLLVLVALTVATPWRPRLGLPAGWFLLTIITVSNLFFPVGILVAERTLYLPSVALALAVALLWDPIRRRAEPGARRALAAAFALLLCAGALRTWLRNPEWDSTLTIYDAVARQHPQSYRAQWALAGSQWEIGNLRTAAERFDLAYMIYPRDSQFLVDYANFFLAIGRYPRALELLEQSRAMHPNVPNTETLLAYAYVLNERHAEALAAVARAERLGAPRATSMPIRAIAYEGLGRRDDAIAAWRVALASTRSASWSFWAFFSRTLARAGDPAQARVALQRARDAAAGDSAALTALDALAEHHRRGCYAPGVPEAQCPDPLGRLEGISKPAAKPVKSLQNATTVIAPSPDGTRGKSTEVVP